MSEKLEWQLIAKDDASATMEKVKRAQDDLATSTKKAASESEKASSTWKETAKGVFTGTAIYDGAKQALGYMKDAFASCIKEAVEFQRIDAQLSAALESTGYAVGFTKQELDNYASELSNLTAIDDDVIKSAEAMLVTFTNVRGEAFKGATMAVLDMATAMKGGGIPSMEELRSTAIQVGKALNDPLTGVTALRKAGVTLSASQQELIEKLTKTGKVAEAQRIVLNELSKEFAGSAVAAAATFEGKLASLNNAFGDVKKNIGLALISAIYPYVDSAKDVAQKTDQATQKTGGLTQAVYSVAQVFKGVFLILRTLIVDGFGDLILIIGAAANVEYNFAKDIIKNFNAIKELGKNVFKALGQAIKGDFSDAWDTIKGGVKFDLTNTKNSLGTMDKIIKKAADATTADFKKAGDAFSEAFTLKNFQKNISEMENAEKLLAEKQKKLQNLIDGLGDGAGAGSGASDSIKTAMKGIIEDYKGGVEKIGESLAKLEEDHTTTVTNITDKLGDLKTQLLEVEAAYQKTIGEMNKSEAEKVVDQEKKIADLKKQIADEKASASDGGIDSKEAARIKELEDELIKEQAAYDAYSTRIKEIDTDVAEARRRANETEFERFVEDLKIKRSETEADFNKKKEQITAEIVEQEASLQRENVVYDGKRKQYADTQKAFQDFHDKQLKNLDSMKKATEKSVNDMNAKLKEMIGILNQIESAKNKAGLLSASNSSGSSILPSSGSSDSSSSTGVKQTTNSVTINFGGVTVQNQAMIDKLVADMKRQLELAGIASQ